MTTRQATPNILDAVLSAQFSQENSRGALVWLPVGRIYDNPYQTRQSYDDEHIQRLADNIWSLREELPATMGMQQPPVARVVEIVDLDQVPVARTAYGDPNTLLQLVLSDRHAVELHFGHNRLRAWQLLRQRDADGYAEFPVFLAFATDDAMWRHAVSENAQRKDITPIEEAMSLSLAIGRFHLTQKQAGEPFGYTNTTVSNKLRLLELPEEYQQLLISGAISERHGRALLTLAPAPGLWHKLNQVQLDALSVAQLETKIAEIIADLHPLPAIAGAGYRVARHNWDSKISISEPLPHDPPAWPYDWAPAKGWPSVVGACQGCEYYVQFGGDPGRRCAHPLGTCHQGKNDAWRNEQADAQRAALLAQQQAARPPAPARVAAPAPVTATSPDGSQLGGAEGKLLLDWTDADWAAYNAALAASQVPEPDPQPVPLPAAPIDLETNSNVFTWFSHRRTWEAPAALIEKGLCNQERCECFRIAYNARPQEDHVRPDPEHAPNLCYGCVNTTRLAHRRKELEHGDLKEYRERLKSEQAECERVLAEGYTTYAGDLWRNPAFLGRLIQHGASIGHGYGANEWELAKQQQAIWTGVAASCCQIWGDGGKNIWSMDKVQEFLSAVASSQATNAAVQS